MREDRQDRWLKSHKNHDLDSWIGYGRSRKNYSTGDRSTDINEVRVQLRKQAKDSGRRRSKENKHELLEPRPKSQKFRRELMVRL